MARITFCSATAAPAVSSPAKVVMLPRPLTERRAPHDGDAADHNAAQHQELVPPPRVTDVAEGNPPPDFGEPENSAQHGCENAQPYQQRSQNGIVPRLHSVAPVGGIVAV